MDANIVTQVFGFFFQRKQKLISDGDFRVIWVDGLSRPDDLRGCVKSDCVISAVCNLDLEIVIAVEKNKPHWIYEKYCFLLGRCERVTHVSVSLNGQSSVMSCPGCIPASRPTIQQYL